MRWQKYWNDYDRVRKGKDKNTVVIFSPAHLCSFCRINLQVGMIEGGLKITLVVLKYMAAWALGVLWCLLIYHPFSRWLFSTRGFTMSGLRAVWTLGHIQRVSRQDCKFALEIWMEELPFQWVRMHVCVFVMYGCDCVCHARSCVAIFRSPC